MDDHPPGNNRSTSVSIPTANRLRSEKSPYLLAHAHNPVQWYPWGDEAFEAALKQDRPVFLSIGYSTCHWCHVMARESFEDEGVASLMNRTFICIKVDREERPDIDQIYMSAAQAMTGRGGWPLTIIMTPDKKPFFAATYIPKTGRFGQAGMMEIIPQITELWANRRGDLLKLADSVMDHLKQVESGSPEIMSSESSEPSESSETAPSNAASHDAGGLQAGRQKRGDLPDGALLKSGYAALASIYDSKNGGFGSAPKFPAPHNLLFLLRYWKRYREDQALKMVEETLLAMRMGGIYDHVGFGFHRYSTDGQWLVPHFEKMLYDQALMTMAFTEAYQATGKEEYAKTAGEILEYVLRDMTAPEGCFFSAEDADSEGMEGRFYLWTSEELKEILDASEFRLMIRLYDIYESGNYENGKNILRQTIRLQSAASALQINEKELLLRVEKIREKLFESRQKRVRPNRDDKILTDWNGLMIAALAKAAQAFEDDRYAKAAAKAADFILRQMLTDDGRLLHRYLGEAGIEGNLDDYAFFVWGLIDLYETVFDARYLKAALQLNWSMMQHFRDDVHGGLFFTPDDGEALPLRKKEYYDAAIPCGNSVALQNALRLSHMTGSTELEALAWDLARAFFSTKGKEAPGHFMMLSSLDYAFGPSSQIVIAGCLNDAVTSGMLRAIRSRFLPNKSVLLVCEDMADVTNGTDAKEATDAKGASGVAEVPEIQEIAYAAESGAGRNVIQKIAPFTEKMNRKDGKTAAFVCTGQTCSLAAFTAEEMMQLLEL